jgi:hypothetical protein
MTEEVEDRKYKRNEGRSIRERTRQDDDRAKIKQ